MEPWLKLKFSKHPEITTRTFVSVFSVSKCRHSHRSEMVISKLVYFQISWIASKLPLSCFQCSTMDPWMKLNFTKHPQIRIWAFLNVFRVSKCRLILRFGMIQSKVVHSQISLIVTKLSLSWLKCSTMNPWLKLEFSKHPEIQTWIFVSVFSVSKCRLSYRFKIVISKLVYFEISLIASKVSLSCFQSSTIDPRMKLNFKKDRGIRIWTSSNVLRVSKCHLSLRFGIIKSKVIHYEISFVVTKLSFRWLQCYTMKPWLKLKFSKHPEIRTWTFMSVFSV